MSRNMSQWERFPNMNEDLDPTPSPSNKITEMVFLNMHQDEYPGSSHSGALTLGQRNFLVK